MAAEQFSTLFQDSSISLYANVTLIQGYSKRQRMQRDAKFVGLTLHACYILWIGQTVVKVTTTELNMLYTLTTNGRIWRCSHKHCGIHKSFFFFSSVLVRGQEGNPQTPLPAPAPGEPRAMGWPDLRREGVQCPHQSLAPNGAPNDDGKCAGVLHRKTAIINTTKHVHTSWQLSGAVMNGAQSPQQTRHTAQKSPTAKACAKLPT